MMAATAYAPNLTDLRGDSAHSSLWSSYGTASHLTGRLGPMDTLHSSAVSARPRTESYPYGRLSQDEGTFERPHHGSLSSHQGGYPSLKRSFSQADNQMYPDLTADLRDEASRLTVSQDHKLLSFRRSQEKSTVVDQAGRTHQLELSAQLHGMFFLSEMPANPSDGTPLQPELTCYRRNLFQISGSFITPRGPISVVNDNNETLGINSMEVTISAIESVDGNPVRLIVIPWKTPPPNSAAEAAQGPDQEPPSLPLIPFQDSNPDADGEYAVYPIGWRRLQFRIATANNGRRKELQQHFVLHLKVYGTLSDGSKVVLSESTTAPIVVRGRSPRNFQARKEIPLLGSSAGSRGQALVETGVGVIASALNVKSGDAKGRGSLDMQMPRSSFTFSPPKPVPGQLNSMRSNSYSSWSGHLPVTTMGDSYSKMALSGAPGFTETPDLPLATSMAPALSQYGATAGQLPGTDSVPRYVDNGRATKSPRHHSHQSVHGSISSADSPADYRYGPYRASISAASDATTAGYGGDAGSSSREYYPSPALTSGTESSSSLAYTGGDGRPYGFEMHKTGSSGLSAKHEATLPGPMYGSNSRGSFESMNNYSWSTN